MPAKSLLSGRSGGGIAESVQPPSVSHTTVMGILWSGTIFSLLVLTLRLTFRIKIIRRLKADDYLVIASFVFYLASTLIWTVLSRNLYLAIESSINPNLVDLMDLIDKSAQGLHGILAGFLLTWTSIWLIKIAFMVFFHGLGRQVRSQRILWWSVFVFIVATYLVVIGTLDFKCLTSNGFDIITNCRRQDTVAYEYMYSRVQLAMDISTDLFIVLVSGNVVWRVSLDWEKKLMLTSICCLTIAMVIVAIVRILVGYSGHTPDVVWIIVWNSVEMTLAILVACIASFRSLYSHTKNTQQKQSFRSQEPSKFSKEHNLNKSFGADTIITAEVSLWERHGFTDLGHSEEALCDLSPTTRGGGVPVYHAA